MPKVQALVLVSGLVQGVYYRDSTRRKALECGVTGWVRNLPDGRVEATFEGEREAVDKMLAWAYYGPPAARVDIVEAQWQSPSNEFGGFDVR